jgi:transcription initiation factor TFIIB
MECGQVIVNNDAGYIDRNRKKENKNRGTNNGELRNLNYKEQLQNDIILRWFKDAKIFDSTENNMARGLADITKLGIELDLPKGVLEKASVLYLKLVKKCSLKGQSITNITIATIYIACKECNSVKSIEEISQISGIVKKELIKSYKFVIKNLKIKSPIIPTFQYLPSICNQLKLSNDNIIILKKLLQTVDKAKLTIGKNPIGIIAASTYISSILSGDYKTQREISEKLRVTQTTIRNRYRELLDHLKIEIYL